MNDPKRALVVGHFSTIGDIESLEFVRGALGEQGIACDIAPYNPSFVADIAGAMAVSSVDPAAYTHLIAVCGPFWPALLDKRGLALERFAHATRIGVNLTMVLAVDEWNPFHVLLERDSSRATRPDITFLQATDRVPVAGLCTIARQREYGDRQQHAGAIELMQALIEARGMAAIDIDTRWPKRRNAGRLGSPAQVMSVIERVDSCDQPVARHGLCAESRRPGAGIDPVRAATRSLRSRLLWVAAVTTVETLRPDDGRASRLVPVR